MRLHEFLNGTNGTLTPQQYNRLKSCLPLAVTYRDGEPHFRDRPRTKVEAVNWIRNKRKIESYESINGLDDLPRQLILCGPGEETPDIEAYLMQKFNIEPGEV